MHPKFVIITLILILWGVTEESVPTEAVMSLEPAGEVGGAHTASYINTVRLSELRAALARVGLAAEFSAGALECCNGTLAVRRVCKQHNHTNTHTHTNTHVHTNIHIPTNTRIHTNTHVHTNTRIHKNSHVLANTHIHTNIHIYTKTHIDTHIHTNTDVYIHTY